MNTNQALKLRIEAGPSTLNARCLLRDIIPHLLSLAAPKRNGGASTPAIVVNPPSLQVLVHSLVLAAAATLTCRAQSPIADAFNPGANSGVYSLAVQADGKILVGGNFTTLGGQTRTNLGRLNNTESATQSLDYSGAIVTWLRGGTSPEIWRTTFDYSTDGLSWTDLGAGTRIAGGWQLAGVSLPVEATLRARGFVTGGRYSASGWFVESRTTISPAPILLSLAREGARVRLSWTGGQPPYQVEQTGALGNPTAWEVLGGPVTTNSITVEVGPGALFLRVRAH